MNHRETLGPLASGRSVYVRDDGTLVCVDCYVDQRHPPKADSRPWAWAPDGLWRWPRDVSGEVGRVQPEER